MSEKQLPTSLIIGAGCLILLLSFGVRSSFGLFMQPMTSDLGWGRETFALALALQHLLWGVAQPVGGAIADRLGTGRAVLGGGILYAAGVYLMALTDTPMSLYLSTGVLIGLGLAGTSFSVVLGAIGRAVPEHQRSMALGIGTAAGSLGQFLMVPTGQALLSSLGWSNALLILALFTLIMLPAAYGVRGRAQVPPGPDQSLTGAVVEAVNHRGFKLLTSGFFVCGFQVAFIAAHLPAYLVDIGFDARVGAWSLALVGLFNIFGCYAAGYIGGRYSKKNTLSYLYIARSIVISLFLILPPSIPVTLIFSSLIGILWLSTVPLTSGIVAQVFGTRYLSTLFGLVFLSHQLGSFIGVWMGGYFFDITGSYNLVWWFGVALGLVAAIMHWPINEQPLALRTPARQQT